MRLEAEVFLRVFRVIREIRDSDKKGDKNFTHPHIKHTLHFINKRDIIIGNRRHNNKVSKDDRVSMPSVKRVWIDLALAVFSLQVIVFAVFVIRHEVAKGNVVGNAPMDTVQVVVVQLAAVMTVATGTTFILFQGVDFIMFLTQLYKERVQRKVKEAKEEGIEEGRAEGRAEGIEEGKAEGKAEEREAWIDWNNRRLEAEAKGEEFNEPPPAEPEVTNGQ